MQVNLFKNKDYYKSEDGKYHQFYYKSDDITNKQIIHCILNPQKVLDKHDAILWNFENFYKTVVTYTNNKVARLKVNTKSHNTIIFDCDKGVDLEVFVKTFGKDFTYFIHSSASCLKDFKKYRIIIPLAKPIEYDFTTKSALYEYFRIMQLDETCLQDSRGFFMPAVTPETFYEYFINETDNYFNLDVLQPLYNKYERLEVINANMRACLKRNKIFTPNVQKAKDWCEKELTKIAYAEKGKGNNVHGTIVSVMWWYKNANGDPSDLIPFCGNHQKEAGKVANSF